MKDSGGNFTREKAIMANYLLKKDAKFQGIVYEFSDTDSATKTFHHGITQKHAISRNTRLCSGEFT